MKTKLSLAVAAAAAASGLAIAAHALLGHDGLTACLPETITATALVGAAVAIGLKARAKVAL